MSIKYYLYKITNLINNKFYIGVHSTEDINDGYMGSGKAIKAAEKKYGLNNFKKEILEYFDSIEEMYNLTQEFLNFYHLPRIYKPFCTPCRICRRCRRQSSTFSAGFLFQIFIVLYFIFY